MLKVIKGPDLRLRVATRSIKKITPGLISTTKEMIKLTKTFQDPEGVGLASTQVGLDGSFFVGLSEEPQKNQKIKFEAFLNPKIISTSKKTQTRFEGCLSIPNYWGEVKRHTYIKVSYQDISGKIIAKTLTGLMAHIFQHEVDHLNGILFPDLVLSQKGKFYKWTGKDETGQDVFEEIN